MARTVTWLNDNGKTCVLTLVDDNSSTVALTPAAEPFTTSIQESDDIFTPIRSSNGYIRIVVDNVESIADLVGAAPKDRAVYLSVNSNARWKGFLACESFTQAWDRGPIEIELPVVSPLEVARGIYPSAALDNLGYINFAQFLVNMNTALGVGFTTGLAWSRFYFPVLSETPDTLQYQFDMKNYATAIDKNTKHEVASYYEILEDICKLFGWQAIEYENDLVFLAADKKCYESGSTVAYRGYNHSKMQNIANGSYASPSDTVSFNAHTPTIFGADHDMSWLAGKKSVEVTGQLNERDEVIWGMDVFQQCEFKGNNYHSEMAVGQPQRYTVKKMGCIHGGNIEVFNNVFSGGASIPDTDGNNIKYARAYLGATNAYGASITYEQFAEYENTLPYKTIVGGSLDFFQRLILKAYSQVAIINARIATNFFYDKTQNQQYNAFRVSADVKYAENATDAFESSWGGQKYLEMSFVIKDGSTEYYYDRTDGWNTEGGVVQIYVSDGKIDEASYNSIPAPDNIKGEFVLYIWSSTDGINDGFIALENLSIQLYTKEGRVKGKQSPRVELDELRENENVDKVQLSNGFTDSWSQDCGLTLAREAVPDSYGAVLNASKAQPSNLYDGKWPEDAMAERANNYFARARRRIRAIVESKNKMLNPMVPYTFTSGGRPFICMEQTHNWRTDEVRANFFEPEFNSL